MYVLGLLVSCLLGVSLIGLLFLGYQEEYIEGEAEADEYRVSSKVRTYSRLLCERGRPCESR